MKKTWAFILLLLAFVTTQAQQPVVKEPSQGGPDNIIFVTGDLKKATQVTFKCDEIDLLQVVEQAGVLSKKIAIRVYRKLEDNTRVVIKIDLAAVIRGKAASVRLRSLDLVEIIAYKRKNKSVPKGPAIPQNPPVRVIP